jgi:protease-4
MEPLTPLQFASLQNMINRGYETFVGRCAEGRGLSVDSIKSIAEGRVWDGATALKIGLVDKLGTLSQCIEDLAKDSNFDSYEIAEYPQPRGKWWEEMLKESSEIKASIIKSELGDALPYYQAINRVKKMSRIQCRMEDVVIE